MLLRFSVLLLLTQSSIQSEVSVKFRLYNQNLSKSIAISTSNYGNFNYTPSLNYVLLCHGYQEGAFTPWFRTAIRAFKQHPNYVVITCDYKKAVSSIYYPNAVDKVSSIAAIIGKLIIGLKNDKNVSMQQFELAGGSLGAHVAGEAGMYVKNNLGVPVYRIFGLDPAGPGFAGTSNRFQKAAAYRTIAIHTSLIGKRKRLAHFDFYPNGGLFQGFCALLHFGNHYVSTYYFTCSINRNCNFVGTLCDSYKSYKNGSCKDNSQNPMGYGALDDQPEGAYYLKTKCI